MRRKLLALLPLVALANEGKGQGRFLKSFDFFFKFFERKHAQSDVYSLDLGFTAFDPG